VNTTNALMKGTAKPVATAFTIPDQVDPIVHLFDITAARARCCDVKTIDAQYGVEKGMTAALLGASFEAFVLDDEMHAMTYRVLRGIEVSDKNLAFDAICAAISGDGHFLGSNQTYGAAERDYHYPTLANRARRRINPPIRPRPKTRKSARRSTSWPDPLLTFARQERTLQIEK
jgi:hypothetical protein